MRKYFTTKGTKGTKEDKHRLEKKIKFTAYVVERHIIMLGPSTSSGQERKAGFKIGFQPEACEEIANGELRIAEGQGSYVQIGGVFIETTDKEFFKQGVRYEVEMTIKRQA